MRLSYTAEALLEMSEAASYYRSCHKELRALSNSASRSPKKRLCSTRTLGAALARLTGASC
jgi:hypothetical protein